MHLLRASRERGGVMKDQLLNCDLTTAEGKKELSRLLGEVLQPYTKHKAKQSLCEMAASSYRCKNCGEKQYDPEQVCPSPRIPLTPDNAFKWRDWAVEKFGASNLWLALRKVWMECYIGQEPFTTWLATKAQPHHYLIAAALCKLNGGDK